MEAWSLIFYYCASAGEFILAGAAIVLLSRLLPRPRRRWLHLPDIPWRQGKLSDGQLGRLGLSRT